ncbi:MAG TPA: RDD family protein [Parafilimonas sp.]|nr:RDD family protein [Parafilimonas sp.]
MEQESLLTELEYNPVLASTGKRFLNYLIDIIIFYVLAVFILAALFYNDDYTYTTSNDFSSQLLIRLIAFALFAAFYFLFEILFKGRTIGKFITGTKAVNYDGSEMEPKTILLRSLSRVVPFEPFSGLGNPCYPWHDKWTRTCVIDVKQTALQNPTVQS